MLSRSRRHTLLDRWTGGDNSHRTQKALKPLIEQGWRFMSAEAIGRLGNDDHVLVSPSGVIYLIETRKLEGIVSLNDGVLTQRFGDDPFAVGRHDLAPRQDLRSRVASLWTSISGPVPPIRWIVAVWGDFRDSPATQDGAMYVAGPQLMETLREFDETSVEHYVPRAKGRWV